MSRVQHALVGPPLPGVTAVEVDGRVVVYSPVQRNAIFLNETASDIWRLADGTLSVDDLAARLASMYDVERSAISDDVRVAVQSFADAGLIAAVT